MTVLVKNNRNETLEGDITFNGSVVMTDKLEPPLLSTGLPSLNANHNKLVPVSVDGVVVGYIKVFPVA